MGNQQNIADLRSNFQVLIFGWIVINFIQSIPSTYFSLYVDFLGGTAVQLALIGSSSTLVSAAVLVFGGYLADSYGRRLIIIICSLGIAMTFVLYAFASSWEFLLLGVILNSLFLVHQPALDALTADSIPPEKRGFGYSLLTFITSVAAIPAPLIAGYLLEQLGVVEGVRVAYLIVIGGWFLVVLARLKLKETLLSQQTGIKWREIFRIIPQAIQESVRVWTRVSSSMRYLLLTNSLGCMFSGIFTYYLILYALDILAISRSEWALLSSLMFLVSVIASLPLGRIIDAIGKKTPLVLSWIFNTASMLLLFHGDFPRLILSFVLYGIANALFASSPALRADLVPREFRGKIMGSQNFMGMLLNSVGILISGFLYDRVSPHIPFILYTIVTLPNIFLTWFFIHEPHKKEL